MIAPQIAAELRHQALALLPTGHRFPVPARELAEHLGVSERTVGGLMADLIEQDGFLIGSSCEPGLNGYFLIQTSEDLELGTRHLVARARAIYARVGKVRRLAAERFADPELLRLFDLDGNLLGPSTEAASAPPTPDVSSSGPVLGLRDEAGASDDRSTPPGAEALPSSSHEALS